MGHHRDSMRAIGNSNISVDGIPVVNVINCNLTTTFVLIEGALDSIDGIVTMGQRLVSVIGATSMNGLRCVSCLHGSMCVMSGTVGCFSVGSLLDRLEGSTIGSVGSGIIGKELGIQYGSARFNGFTYVTNVSFIGLTLSSVSNVSVIYGIDVVCDLVIKVLSGIHVNTGAKRPLVLLVAICIVGGIVINTLGIGVASNGACLGYTIGLVAGSAMGKVQDWA